MTDSKVVTKVRAGWPHLTLGAFYWTLSISVMIATIDQTGIFPFMTYIAQMTLAVLGTIELTKPFRQNKES